MNKYVINVIIVVFLFAACEAGSNGVSLDGTTDPTPAAVDPWSIEATTALTTVTMNGESIYLIETWRDFEYISNNFETSPDLLTFSYYITNNITFPDLTSTPSDRENEPYVINDGLTPIGTENNPFTGHINGMYEGNDSTISNLVINEINQDNVGLFGTVGDSDTFTTFKNIRLEDININGNRYVGGLIGRVSGANIEIDNSHVTGAIFGNSGQVGGLIGGISYSGNTVLETPTTVTNSSAHGTVSGVNNYVGGLIGILAFNENVTIENNHTTNVVTGLKDSVGGLIGFIFTGESTIRNSYATGNVTGKGFSGGFIGNISSTAENTYVENSYATGDVTGTQDKIGGLIGNISGRNNSIIDSYAIGDVETSGNTLGGLVGNLEGETNLIDKCYSTGDVSGNSNNTTPQQVGGFLGALVGNSNNVTNNYSDGAVSGTSQVGGFIGYFDGSNNVVATNYSRGSVSGEYDSSGGFIGKLMLPQTITSNYWNADSQSMNNLFSTGQYQSNNSASPLTTGPPSGSELALEPARFNTWNSNWWSIPTEPGIWPTLQ